jgi:N utilization substance protein A
MKSDFLLAITQLSAEKNLPREVVIAAVEAALVSAYRKENFAANQNISVKISPATGKVQVWAEKVVVERPSDTRTEISLEDARQIKSTIAIGEAVMVESTPSNAGRIAAQTAKQVILQRLHEAEHSAILEEYSGREGALITGLVQRIESRQIFVDLGRTEALLPATEEVPTERYRIGQRLKAIILEVAKTSKGPRVILSRSHPDLVRRLFEIEVPEIYSGVVEVKSIAREAGSRTKVAVTARQEGVDAVGCCVGLRGIRIQNIVNEMSGEKIDVVAWSSDAGTFIANALSPAQILSVELNRKDGVASVVVPDRQLSVAIGKEGQNVRLAAKLTGWRIDIKSATAAEAEKAAFEAQKATEAEKFATEKAEVAESATKAKGITVEEAAEVEPAVATEVEEEVEAVVSEEAPAEVPAEQEPVAASAETAQPSPSLESAFPFSPPTLKTPASEKSELRFAEDIMRSGAAKSQTKSKKKKKKKDSVGKEGEEVVGGRKARRGVDYADEEEEY